MRVKLSESTKPKDLCLRDKEKRNFELAYIGDTEDAFTKHMNFRYKSMHREGCEKIKIEMCRRECAISPILEALHHFHKAYPLIREFH